MIQKTFNRAKMATSYFTLPAKRGGSEIERSASFPGRASLTRTLMIASGFLIVGTCFTTTASAQITPARSMAGGGTAVATLDEQLINRLRATTDVQAEYIRYVVKLVDQHKLESRLVIAVEQYAIRRNPRYPFPYFERALHYESAKRGVVLPSMRLYQSTAIAR